MNGLYGENYFEHFEALGSSNTIETHLDLSCLVGATNLTHEGWKENAWFQKYLREKFK